MEHAGHVEDFAVRYVNLLETAYAVVKSSDPGAQVVLAGIANNSPSYLAHLYRFGARGYFDVAAIHPYTATARGVLTLVGLT